MKLFKSYNKFSAFKSINENVDKAKKFLKDRYIIRKAAEELRLFNINDSNDDLGYAIKDGKINTLKVDLRDKDGKLYFTPEQQKQLKLKMRDIKVSPEEMKKLTQDKAYLEIMEMLKGNEGYVYMFTYFYFAENYPMENLKTLYQRVLNLKDLLPRFSNMPEVNKKKFDMNFIDVKLPTPTEPRSNVEILTDGLQELELYRSTKKIIDELPKKLRDEFRTAPKLVRQQLSEIADAFENVADGNKKTKIRDLITNKRISKKESIWRGFFGQMIIDTMETNRDGSPNPNFGKPKYASRLRDLENQGLKNFIQQAKSYLENVTGDDAYLTKLNIIDRVYQKYGVLGVDVKYDKNGFIILDVKSYSANAELNAECRHCIVSDEHHWDSYLGMFNKQYYIYNFHLITDPTRVIGVTINKDGGIRAAHDINNGPLGSNFRSILKKWEREYNLDEDLWSYFKPLSPEEIKVREKAEEANRRIGDEGLSLDKLKEYVLEYGANINKDDAKALINAVKEGDMEKIEWCLKRGANPNLAKKTRAAISQTKDLEIIKKLLEYGADMTTDVYKNIMDDNDKLEYCLDAGMDPNLENSMPFRKACQGTYNIDTGDLGVPYFNTIKLLLHYGARITNDLGRDTIIKYAANYYRIEVMDYIFRERGDEITDDNLIRALNWLTHNYILNEDQLNEVTEYLKNKIKQKDKFRIDDDNGKLIYYMEK